MVLSKLSEICFSKPLNFKLKLGISNNIKRYLLEKLIFKFSIGIFSETKKTSFCPEYLPLYLKVISQLNFREIL